MKALNNDHRKYSISNLGNSEADRVEFMIKNMNSIKHTCMRQKN